jgi:excinuclease UvrABC nuclease subunit
MKKTDQTEGSECPIPNAPGVYRHIDKRTGEIKYIGQTEDLRVRQQQHVRSGRLDPKKQWIVWRGQAVCEKGRLARYREATRGTA